MFDIIPDSSVGMVNPDTMESFHNNCATVCLYMTIVQKYASYKNWLQSCKFLISLECRECHNATHNNE